MDTTNDFANIWKKQTKNSAKSKSGSANTTTKQQPHLFDLTLYEPDVEEDEFLRDMPAYCAQLDLVLIHAKKMLNRAYEQHNSKKLSEKLQKHVAELRCVQKEIRTISNNLSTMKIQINSVRKNAEEHKSKLHNMRNEERRTRFMLNSESKHPSATRFSPALIPIPRFGVGPTNALVLPTRVSSNSLSSPNLNVIDNYVPETRIFKTAHRNLTGSNNKAKLSRPLPKLKINKSLLDENQNHGNNSNFGGVTVYLHPISENERNDNPTSERSTSNTSVANIPWLTTYSASETTTFAGSIVSDTNSLSVINSVGTVEDVD